MYEHMPPFVRSIHPPYRIRPRSAVSMMPDDDPPSGIIERLVAVARQMLPPGT